MLWVAIAILLFATLAFYDGKKTAVRNESRYETPNRTQMMYHALAMDLRRHD